MQNTMRRIRKDEAARPAGRLDFCFLVFGVLCTVACLAALLILGAGCDGNKKAALTPEEVTRMTLAKKPLRPDQLLVSGETIRCEDILATSPQDGLNAVQLKDKLVELAQQTTLEQFLSIARPVVGQRLNDRVTNVVLYKRARKEYGDTTGDNLDKLGEKELRRYIVDEHGGNAAEAEAALRKLGMNRSSYKEWIKRQRLAQYFVAQKYGRNQPVTYDELVARYDELKNQYYVQRGVVQFRLIDIQAAKIEVTDPNDDPIALAQSRGTELRQRIDAGEDFAVLAKQYSHDAHREEGGLWPPRDPNSLAAPYDVIARETQRMKPGDVAGPLETFGHVFLIKLQQKQEQGYRPFSEVQGEVRDNILVERRRQWLRELDDEIKRQVALAEANRFVDYCLERLYREATEAPPAH